MRIKTLLLVIAVACVAPAIGSAQERLSVADRIAAWFSPFEQGSFAVAQTGYQDPCYAEDFYCPDGRCGDCVGCCRQYGTWGSLEMLLWWAKGSPLPPLVTTAVPGPIDLTMPPGALNNPNTRILFGDELGADKVQFGWRMAAGVWMDADHNTAVGGRFFILGGDTSQFSASSDGDVILGRPFFNVLLDQQDVRLLAITDSSGTLADRAGSVRARSAQLNTLGAEAITEFMIERDYDRRVDVLVGYQFFRFDDWLRVDAESTFTSGPLTGIGLAFTDRFSTQNEFHGGEVGIKGRLARGCWSLDGLAKIGIGSMNQRVTISGHNTAFIDGVPGATNAGGLLAQPSNIGVYSRNKFAYIPELTFNLRYYATRCLSFHVGYNIMWISDVALAGDQIDFRVNEQQGQGGPQRPAFRFRDDDYWLQGINFGVNWDF